VCGNGILEPGEECDYGAKNGTGTGCQKDCTFTCIPESLNGNAECDDHNPCNGVETCAGADAGVPDHTCKKGTPLPDRASCGTGTCRQQMCTGGVCGDGIIEMGEECDNGAQNGPGTGCETDCKFSCKSGDATRDCAPTACVGQGTCNDTTHVCQGGTAMNNGTPCGTNQVCESGSCISVKCGDGIIEPPEQCDFGSANGLGAGCESNCTFSCTQSPNDDCLTPDPCGGINKCTTISVMVSGSGTTASGQKCVVGSPAADATPCPNGGSCQNHLCVTANCGNGALDPGEQCDWGTAQNVTGSGCEPDCTFTCSSNPLSSNACPNLDPCSATPQACQTVAGPTGNAGAKCASAPVLASCASCTGGDICVANVCKPSTCGDGCVVPPETCDPPNGSTCSATCQKVICGDGVLEGPEQCDDGNTVNLDGCDSNCFFEQLQRNTTLDFLGSTDSFCTANLLGSQAFTAAGLNQIQSAIDADVNLGRTNVIFKFMPSNGMPADLTGTSGPVVIGTLSGTPEIPDGGAYNGNSDLDVWYLTDPTMVDSARNPLTTVMGTFNNKKLSVTSGRLTIKMQIAGSPAKLDIWNVQMQQTIGAASAPTLSTTGASPGHLASEHVQPGLMSFETAGVGANGPTAELCGNTTAASLKAVPVPPIIATGGMVPCTEGYKTATNSLLDVIIHGCTVSGTGVFNPTQPDPGLADPSAPLPTGTKAPYTLSASSTSTLVIDTCTDGSTPAKSVPIATCLKGLAYSSAFLSQTDRVILK
jgi:cysteine-rich repeat protein